MSGFHEEDGQCVSNAPVDAGCAVTSGAWVGVTDQSLAVRFTVSTDTTAVTAVRLEANVATPAGTQRVAAENAGPVTVAGCRFAAPVGSGQIVAAFGDAGAASGSWSQTVIQGETAYTSTGTWMAAPCGGEDGGGCVVADAGTGADAGTDAGAGVDGGAGADGGGARPASGISTIAGVEATVFAEGLLAPSGIAVDSAGRVFVAEYAVDRVLRFDADGGTRVVVAGRDAGISRPLGLAVGADDTVFVAGATRIVAVAADGGVSAFGDPPAFEVGGLLPLSVNDIVATEASFSTAGTSLFRVPASGAATVIASGFSSPLGVAPLDAGVVLLAEADFGFANSDGVYFYEVTIATGATTNLTPIPLVARPGAIAARPGAAAFAVAETELVSGEPARLFLYNRSTNGTSDLASGFSTPMGVAFSAPSRLLVTEFSAGRVVSIQGAF